MAIDSAPKPIKYKCLTPVNHDNVRHEIGEIIELSRALAKPLLAVFAIEKVEE